LTAFAATWLAAAFFATFADILAIAFTGSCLRYATL